MCLLLFLFFTTAAAQSAGQSVLICSTQSVTVLSGDDVILQCGLQPPMSAESMRVEWTRPDLDPQFVHVHQDGQFLYNIQNPSYNYRTTLFVDQLINGNVSLKLSRVIPSDTGTYRCSLPSIQQEAVIHLTVSSNVIGSHEPVHAVVGDDVILPCHLEPPFDVTTLRVDWKFNGLTVHVYRNMRDDPDPQHSQFNNRTSLFRNEMHKGNISLKLMNVTETDAGNYSCYVPTLESQVTKGYVPLIVDLTKDETNKGDNNPTESPSTDLSSGGIAGIMIAIIVVIAFVIGAIAFSYYKKKRSSQDRNPTNRQTHESSEEERPENIPLVAGPTANTGNTEENHTVDVEPNNGENRDMEPNNDDNTDDVEPNNRENQDVVSINIVDSNHGENTGDVEPNNHDNTDDVENDDDT